LCALVFGFLKNQPDTFEPLWMVEITSENETYPIECALQLGERRGWRAAKPGPQIIRLLSLQS
jgi:hypothetical protein